MESGNLRDTIKELTRIHLEDNNGLLYAQCVKAVGWIAGTVPQIDKGIIELPTSDASNGGIVVGAALAGRNPIYVCRYQGFMWYNAVSLVNYAAKSQEMWGQPCPMFIRSLGMEGNIGPVASNQHHGMIARMPGIEVYAPMTPEEYYYVWEGWQFRGKPVYCSEHRGSYTLDQETYEKLNTAIWNDDARISIFPIGGARLSCLKLAEQLDIPYDLYPIVELNKDNLRPWYKKSLLKTNIGLVIDDDYAWCGCASSVANNLTEYTGMPVYSLGLEERSACFGNYDNVYPSVDRIIEKIMEITN